MDYEATRTSGSQPFLNGFKPLSLSISTGNGCGFNFNYRQRKYCLGSILTKINPILPSRLRVVPENILKIVIDILTVFPVGKERMQHTVRH